MLIKVYRLVLRVDFNAKHGGRRLAITDVIAQIDAEIAKLQQAKSLLSGAAAAVKSGRGRPKGSKNSTSVVKSSIPPAAAKVDGTPKRKLSPEGRKAIADAMKRRWAERRKPATK